MGRSKVSTVSMIAAGIFIVIVIGIVIGPAIESFKKGVEEKKILHAQIAATTMPFRTSICFDRFRFCIIAKNYTKLLFCFMSWLYTKT